MPEEPTPQPQNPYMVISLAELVKQTLYRKYQQALNDLNELQKNQLRTQQGRIHPTHAANFKASVIALIYEIKPKIKTEQDLEKLNPLCNYILNNPNKAKMEEYKMVLVECGQFLDRVGITKIYPQTQSGAAGMTGR